MTDNRVVIKRINAPHQEESFTLYRALSQEMVDAVNEGVASILDELGGSSLLKSSGRVYIKPNGIDAKAYCHTRTEVVEAVIRYWFEAGAEQVFLMENSTQSNYTRIVYEVNGYRDICRRTGAVPVYLDEERPVHFTFTGKKGSADGEPLGYDLTDFEMPETVAQELMERRRDNLYVNLPKLKTHSMAGVTLGVKNQWGFPVHEHRGADHNYNLAHKLVDVLSLVKPDVTLIEGVEGTIHGHYPVTALADTCVKPFRVFVGSRNVVAADMVGAKIFGLAAKDIPHLKLALDRGLGGGVKKLRDIELNGDITSLSGLDLLGDMPRGGYPTDLVDSFPADVNLIYGKELACKEGCVNNPRTLLQVLHHDYQGRGGWTLIMGKGFDKKEIDSLTGRVLVAGHCAIEEISGRLISRLGRKNVYLSGECNDLAATTAAMLHLARVNPLEFTPINPLRSLRAYFTAKLKGSRSRVPSPLCHIFKTV